jgi:hypothetical protein
MISINYQKRKNAELFNRFEESNTLFLSKTQNYIPIYTRFFNLNDTNYNSINLNNKWFLSNVEPKENTIEGGEDNKNLYNCRIKNVESNKVKDRQVFFKMAPLLDPYKYMIGKYDTTDPKLFNLPKINSTSDDCNPKFIDCNNAAYVDGMFLFLSSQLRHTHKFINGVDYYGSFLAIKNNFKLNVFDDIDYLNNSEFFNKNKNVLFNIDNYDHLFQQESAKLKPITIGNNISLKSLKSVDNDMFEDIFDDNANAIDLSNATSGLSENDIGLSKTTFDLDDLKDMSIDLVDLTHRDLCTDQHVTLKSQSTCSSRSSYTNDEDMEDCEHCDTPDVFDSGSEKYDENNSDENDEDDEGNWTDDNSDDDEDIEEERIEVTIPKFPVQVIAMEYCENTFDDLILTQDLTTEEWLSAFMQIIMTLIAYQKAFNFTHNDLHTNNVMYNHTDKKYLYYCYKKKHYKVPTFGRIFKIIDFGRSIFKFDGKTFCSDSFQNGGDAATQYNTEPYFNEKKPRLEPNPSFDLCRLACSIFDYIIDDFEEMKDLSKITDPIKRLVFEWCLDDKGINMLYKNNGLERYPEFKLYKMIARCVHNHTPQAQLERPEFDAFSTFYSGTNGVIKHMDEVIDIDKIPSHI